MTVPSRASTAAFVGLILALTAANASARDDEFSLLVRHIESHYHTRHTHGFILGFASLVVQFGRPHGVKNLKLAIFENQDFSADGNDLGFDDVVRQCLQQGWHLMVQVDSRRNGSRTYIFARDLGKDIKFLIATIDHRDAVVLQIRFDPEKLDRDINRWVNESGPKTVGD